jgi:hypothetical protein
MHLCNRWGTGEIKIFRASDYAQVGSVKLLEDADSIGENPDTKHPALVTIRKQLKRLLR